MEAVFKYNVFISYSHRDPDKSWVRNTLLRELTTQRIGVCIDFQDFRIGFPLVTEMERAVEQSRYTLAVLSDAYLKSGFAEFENILCQHLGLETSENRLLLVSREPCTANLRLRYKLQLDMTNDEEFNQNMPRLVQALRQPIDIQSK